MSSPNISSEQGSIPPALLVEKSPDQITLHITLPAKADSSQEDIPRRFARRVYLTSDHSDTGIPLRELVHLETHPADLQNVNGHPDNSTGDDIIAFAPNYSQQGIILSDGPLTLDPTLDLTLSSTLASTLRPRGPRHSDEVWEFVQDQIDRRTGEGDFNLQCITTSQISLEGAVTAPLTLSYYFDPTDQVGTMTTRQPSVPTEVGTITAGPPDPWSPLRPRAMRTDLPFPNRNLHPRHASIGFEPSLTSGETGTVTCPPTPGLFDMEITNALPDPDQELNLPEDGETSIVGQSPESERD